MASHRNSITISIQAQDHPILQQCVNDKSLRVMVFCAAANYGVQDIAFPHQSELKVNADDVKANLRGLKNKPGSTRPVDITDLLRLRPASYNNAVEFTYALTQKAGAKASSSQVRRDPPSLCLDVFLSSRFLAQADISHLLNLAILPCHTDMQVGPRGKPSAQHHNSEDLEGVCDQRA